MGKIDISDVDVCSLVRELWKNMTPASFFLYSGMTPPSAPSDNQIMEAVSHGYIDYLAGRCIKTDFSTKTVNTDLYNRDAGAGAFEKIVQKLRTKQ